MSNVFLTESIKMNVNNNCLYSTGFVLLFRTVRDISTPAKTPVLVRLVCTLVPRSASVALYEQAVVSSARTGTTEGFRALNCTCFGTFQSSVGASE